uniref:Carn_acyltransf domain-containing protein n=1 Tax=Heterorhabditis bacteriophora TaxID=37862 RepID=A0A1I7XBZ8_HETBA
MLYIYDYILFPCHSYIQHLPLGDYSIFFRDTNKHHFVTPDSHLKDGGDLNIRELEFILTDSLMAKIEKAQKTHQFRNNDLDFATVEYNGMTRDTIKKTKLSPDSVMQLAIQNIGV